MWMKMNLNEFWPLLDEENGGEPPAGGSLATGAADPAPAGGEPAGAEPAPATPAPEAGGQPPTKPDEPVVPEKYEFTAPEGVELDEGLVARFSEVAKGLKLSQEGAQQLADLYADQLKQLVEGQVSNWTATRKEWVDAAKADQEYGGANFEANRAHVANAMKKFGTPELAKALDEYGFGDNPELVRFFYRVGKLVSEPQFHTGSGDTSGAKSPEKVLYPNMS